MLGCVCICSRGLVHSRTVEAVLANLQNLGGSSWSREWRVLLTHDLPIPEAQNKITERALFWRPEFIWFVEEDMVPPAGILAEMLTAAGDQQAVEVVAADYRLQDTKIVRRGRAGQPIYAGMGCLLVRSAVFSRLERPWFEASQWHYDQHADKWTRIEHSGGRKYGGQDIHFFAKLHEAGIPFRVVGECQHLRVTEMGAAHTNSGCHRIEAL